MPNRPVDAKWVTRIYTLYATKGLRAGAIAKQLAQEAGLGDVPPSPRTVQRRLDEWLDKPPEERERYRQYYWPESHPAALPWEAAPAALEMLGHYANRGRPLVGVVQWFWRVTLAAPAASYERREWAALQLAGAEVAGAKPNDASVRSVEGWLVDFTSGRHAEATSGKKPIIARRVSVPKSAAPKDRIAVIEALAGFPLDQQARSEIEALIDMKEAQE